MRRPILLFDSIHHVLSAEKRLRGRGTWCDLVPVPSQLSSDCGMAVEVEEDDLGEVLADGDLGWRSAWRRDGDRWVRAEAR